MNALARFTEVRGTAGDLRGYLAHFGTHAVRLHPGQPQPVVDADADRKAGLEQLAETLHAAALAGDVRAIRHALAVHVLGKPFGNPARWYWHLAVEIGAEIEVEALVGSLPGLHEGHMTAEDAARDAVATVAQWEDAKRAFVAPLPPQGAPTGAVEPIRVWRAEDAPADVMHMLDDGHRWVALIPGSTRSLLGIERLGVPAWFPETSTGPVVIGSGSGPLFVLFGDPDSPTEPAEDAPTFTPEQTAKLAALKERLLIRRAGAVPDPRDPDFTGPYLQPQERTRGGMPEERCIQCDSPVDRCQGLH